MLQTPALANSQAVSVYLSHVKMDGKHPLLALCEVSATSQAESTAASSLLIGYPNCN